jgi:Lrp/AsnC family transcriptional regulator, leucine-responsive regulatory protein
MPSAQEFLREKRPMAEIDTKDCKLLAALQDDARLPLKALAQACGLSLAATAERVKRLEERGYISGYHAAVDAVKLGLQVKAVIGITVQQPGKKKFIQLLKNTSEVIECHHVTGADSFLLTAVLKDVGHLEEFLARINGFGETRTSIVMSTPIVLRPIHPGPK